MAFLAGRLKPELVNHEFRQIRGHNLAGTERGSLNWHLLIHFKFSLQLSPFN